MIFSKLKQNDVLGLYSCLQLLLFAILPFSLTTQENKSCKNNSTAYEIFCGYQTLNRLNTSTYDRSSTIFCMFH